MDLIFATQNRNKFQEIAALIPPGFNLSPLSPGLFPEELDEPFDKLELNALHKARTVSRRTGKTTFADDSGLEVDALDGAPGVYSARYAGEEKNPDKNMDQLLSSMKGVSNRNAQFRTVIVLANGNQEKIFEGIVRGKILEEKRGTSGFGYDPVFQPEGHTKTFAEMSPEEKNSISHRAIATGKLLAFLTGQAERKIAG